MAHHIDLAEVGEIGALAAELGVDRRLRHLRRHHAHPPPPLAALFPQQGFIQYQAAGPDDPVHARTSLMTVSRSFFVAFSVTQNS